MPIAAPDAQTLRATAHRLADAAARETLARFRARDPGAENKAADGFDPVTEADRAAERAMRAVLAEARPDDAIMGEEYEGRAGTSGLTWILDPIDGTRGYVAGTPTWGTLVAVADATGPVFGLIDQPWTGERFEGGFGRAVMARLGRETPLAVSTRTGLDAAILFSTFPEIGSNAERAAFARVSGRVRLTRYGADCYAYALLAAGHVDLVIEAGLKLYDIAAPMAVIEAAGGIVTDWQGARVGVGGQMAEGGQVLAAANPALHAAALALLSGPEG